MKYIRTLLTVSKDDAEARSTPGLLIKRLECRDEVARLLDQPELRSDLRGAAVDE